MKIFSFILISLFIFRFSFSQENCYRVIKVVGEAKLESTGEMIKKNDIICLYENSNAKIIFKTAENYITVMKDNGRFNIMANPKDKNPKDEFISDLLSNLLPTQKSLISKGVKSTIETEFEEIYSIIDDCKIEFDTLDYKISENNFFLFEYLKNDSIISREIITERNELVLSKEYFTNAEIENVNLVYKSNGIKLIIVSFKLIIPNLNELKSEIKIIVDELNGVSNKEKIEIIKGFVHEFYGKVNEDSLNELLKKDFGL